MWNLLKGKGKNRWGFLFLRQQELRIFCCKIIAAQANKSGNANGRTWSIITVAKVSQKKDIQVLLSSWWGFTCLVHPRCCCFRSGSTCWSFLHFVVFHLIGRISLSLFFHVPLFIPETREIEKLNMRLLNQHTSTTTTHAPFNKKLKWRIVIETTASKTYKQSQKEYRSPCPNFKNWKHGSA